MRRFIPPLEHMYTIMSWCLIKYTDSFNLLYFTVHWTRRWFSSPEKWTER